MTQQIHLSGQGQIFHVWYILSGFESVTQILVSHIHKNTVMSDEQIVSLQSSRQFHPTLMQIIVLHCSGYLPSGQRPPLYTTRGRPDASTRVIRASRGKSQAADRTPLHFTAALLSACSQHNWGKPSNIRN
jgi:hypothetical protein